MKTFRELLNDLENDSEQKEKLESSKWLSESSNENFIALICLHLIYMAEYETRRLWKNFKNEIKHQNRFLPESELLETIKEISGYATVQIPKGTVLYRSREYRYEDYLKNPEIIALYEELKKECPNMDLEIEDLFSEAAMNTIALMVGTNDNQGDAIIEALEKAVESSRPFWGFGEEDSDAPPIEYSKEGRVNPKGISYLYAAMDEKTAIMEMHPKIGQNYSVCKIEIISDVKLFDFTYFTTETKEDDYKKANDLYAISKEFSEPNYGCSEDYIPTQYLSEYIKKMGYDGIRFKSSVSPEGINVVLFCTEKGGKKYKIIESKVYNVDSLNIEISQFLPTNINVEDREETNEKNT